MSVHFGESGLEQFIGTVDVWALPLPRWPFMRLLARRYVEARQLCRYERELLSSGAWARVRCSPHLVDAAAAASSTHVFDVYGVPSPQLS